MFKKRAAVFYRDVKTRGAECFCSEKYLLRVFWTASKIFHKKRVSWESKQRFKLRGENNNKQEKQAMPYQYSLNKDY